MTSDMAEVMTEPYRLSSGKFLSKIPGVSIRVVDCYKDIRGEVAEIWREDTPDCDGDQCSPVMAYFSLTYPDVRRGPHEHMHQTDRFFFMDGSDIELHLWDNRLSTETEKITSHEIIRLEDYCKVIIPPRVVHGYRNRGKLASALFNFPDKLYRGVGKAEEVDEVRWELIDNSPFRF
jgi:dTDP-4-dehydrorhamnose 3,5-epimerase